MKHNTKRAVASILTAMMALGAFGIAGCKNDEQGAVIPAPETQESTTQSGGTSASRPMVNKEVYGEPYKGTIVRCGQSYDWSLTNALYNRMDASILRTEVMSPF